LASMEKSFKFRLNDTRLLSTYLVHIRNDEFMKKSTFKHFFHVLKTKIVDAKSFSKQIL